MTPVGRVTIAGIGPGGTLALLTCEVYALLHDADVVIYAGTMFSASLRECVRGHLMFAPDLSDFEIRETVRDAVRNNLHVAWLEPGDPALYSGEPGRFGSMSENAEWLASEGIPFRVLPGVSSLNALTASAKIEHTNSSSGTPLVIYAPMRDTVAQMTDRLEIIFSLRCPVALFLAIERFEEIVVIALKHFPITERCIVGYRLSWDDELIINTTLSRAISLVREHQLQKHALVLIGPWKSSALP